MYDFRNILELNTRANYVLSGDERLSSLSVKGELSNVKIYDSHNSHTCYLTLKDTTSNISCIMFDSNLSALNFTPEDGLKVTVTGSLSVYAAKGSYRLIIHSMTREGQGDLAEQMRKLYEKLNKEGIFDPSHKLRLPLLPRRIGVISSSKGAVIHDIIHTLSRRNPHFDILLYPAAVSGEACVTEVCAGIDYFMSQRNVDVIIIARGGGSKEELWSFNDERIARKIYSCDIPTISAVGHDTAVSICDYVADVSAPTPTAAAELVMPSLSDLKGKNANLREMLNISVKGLIDSKRTHLRYLSENKALYTPLYNVELHRNRLNTLKERFRNITDNRLTAEKTRLTAIRKNLDLLGPANTLSRGYSYVTLGDKTVTSVSSVKKGDEIRVVLSDGEFTAIVDSKKENR